MGLVSDILKSGADQLIGGGLGIVSNLLGSKDAKTAAAAQAQDTRTTGVTDEFFKQLQQSISQMDKSVAEKLFGTSNTTDIINQLQTMQQQQQTTGNTATDQTQTTIRGDAGANNAVLQNIMQLSQQFGSGGQQAMDAAINKVLRSGAGALAGVGNRSGTFGDTTTAILQNDLATRAAEAGVLAQQNAQTATSNSLAQLMQALQGGQEVTKGNQVATNTQNTNTTGTTQNTGTNTSSTQTTQDRTAQETAAERTATSTEGQSKQTTDTFNDALKDKTAGVGTNNNPLATLGQGIGTAPTIGTGAPGTPGAGQAPGGATTNPLAGFNLQLPALPATGAPVTAAVMGGQPSNAPVAQVAQPGAAVGGVPQVGGPAAVNPLTGIVQTTQPLDPNNPLGQMGIELPGYVDQRFAVM